MDQSTFEYAQIDSVATVRQASAHYIITRSAANFAAILDAEVPDGPDKTHLMRLLREMVTSAHLIIARQSDD